MVLDIEISGEELTRLLHAHLQTKFPEAGLYHHDLSVEVKMTFGATWRKTQYLRVRANRNVVL